MLQILIKDLEAMDELKKSHGLKPYDSLLQVLRKVSRKLICEDDTLEFMMPLHFLSEPYQKNPQAFCFHIKKGLGLQVLASKNTRQQIITFRIGFDIETFGFAKNLTKKLMKPTIFAVDVPVDSIPPAYLKQIHHFLNRLSKRIGKKITRLNLGEDIRFIKPKK